MPKPLAVQTKTGKRFRVRFRDLDGRSTSETFDTFPDAQAFCDDIAGKDVEYALDRLTRRLASEEAPTLSEVAEQFFARKASRVSAGTLYDYRKSFERRIEPTFGSRRVTSITTKDVQAWIEACIADGMAAKSVLNHHGLLHSLFKFAGSANGIGLDLRNPCEGTELPKKPQKPDRALRPEDWEALRDSLIQVDTNGAELAEFLLASGFRWSEATALDGLHVSKRNGGDLLTVTMSNVVRKTTPGHFEIVQQSGKGQASRRSITLSPRASDLIRARQERMPDPNGLIFTTKTGARWTYSNFYARIWRPALKIAGLLDRTPRPSPHALRHTHLTWLSQGGGANIAQVSGRAGHSNVDITVKTYARGITDVPEAAVAALDDVIFGKVEA